MKDLFEGIAYLFEEVLFAPFNAMRELELENWTVANTVNWLFMIIGAVAMVYWVMQLKKFNDNNEESKDVTAHSYL
ncbi:uracil phosphoribosyltransferase [Kordia algicida OT-1]|uniref:Uracil phosphoribosyltransferase n=1 Tax=Kordia algicida OT-1 TaxID=391587 RepID=A9DSS0_9FLAO|nr:hypothetical protein [Kordia algicida]EDP96973.1 hypothetical protein KAOT1_17458 [Kordia algicida OT-1]